MRNRTTPYHFIRNGRWVWLALCCWLCQCVQTYVSPYKSPPTGYLVVEGFISTNDRTQFTLSRTIGLNTDSSVPPVIGAAVQVEGSDSSIFGLPDQGNGVYGDTTLPLNPAAQYRLRIRTNGETYLSDFVPVKPSPPIDSINWTFDYQKGVTVYANTHDPGGTTRYYRWSYDQTWEYDMTQRSLYYYDANLDTVLPRQPGQFVSRCWIEDPSTQLLIGTSAKLAQDEIYEYPLVTIAKNTQPLGVLYSIQVTQYALTAGAYNFITQMQQNTESLGSLFDALPAEVAGNIHCLTNPAEPVIGYISAGTVTKMRIFIKEDQLPNWYYYITCGGPDYEVPNIPDSLTYYFLYSGYTPISATLTGWESNSSYCVDCTTDGGSNVKPSFWPN